MALRLVLHGKVGVSLSGITGLNGLQCGQQGPRRNY